MRFRVAVCSPIARVPNVTRQCETACYFVKSGARIRDGDKTLSYLRAFHLAARWSGSELILATPILIFVPMKRPALDFQNCRLKDSTEGSWHPFAGIQQFPCP
jgi:hypothetical protein